MTLSYPVINRARQILWVVTGIEKIKPLGQLLSADSSIPPGRIRRDKTLVLADEAAVAHNKKRVSHEGGNCDRPWRIRAEGRIGC